MTAEWMDGVRQTLDALKEWFPAAFGRPRPLKVGIHDDLLARAPAISPLELSRALGFYCRTARYLKVLRDGGPRIDLDGNESGPAVTPEQAAGAKAAIDRMKAKKAPAAAVKTPIEIAASPPPPTPPPTTPTLPDPDEQARLARERYRRMRGLGVRV